MKFSVLHTKNAQYQFAVTTDGVHRSVEGLPTLTEAMHLTLAELKTRTAGATTTITGELAPPIAAEIELWGAGVTYLRSRDARKEESGVPDVYQRVYEADRPELFFKSTAVRARGTNAPIGIRYDSEASVPEPEVAIYINKHREIIGYAICNDVTARSIEGENPLYLSQAKIYIGSTAIGPDITPAWLAPAANEMSIKAKILRGSALVWEAETSLGALNRTLEDLVNYVFRCQDFPHGLILSTGTGIVPPMDIALAAGDIVEINVAGVGTLSNTVEVIPER
ncbi:COG3970 Fumarylacetoacetate (FAA) hydrolase family protein [Candidatus Planktophila dulcis]|uniref:fumarylacetoacetate hydrolase family protein n=1 Tax=Candidatus Planktophila dulcis TaxID=1884914 RepID=UPI003CEFB7ED